MDDGEKQVMTVNLPDWNKESELVVRGLTKTFTEENRTVLADIHFTIRGFKK